MERPALIAAIYLALISGPVWAHSISPLGAEGIEQADIAIFIGGGLGRDNPGQLELFGGDSTRTHQFEASLRHAMAERLAKSGIAVEVGAESVFAVSIYGRPVDGPNSCDRYAVLIKFSIANARYPKADQPVTERGVLETPTDARLEQEIQSRVLMILDEDLENARAHGN